MDEGLGRRGEFRFSFSSFPPPLLFFALSQTFGDKVNTYMCVRFSYVLYLCVLFPA